MEIRPIDATEIAEVVALWERCELTRPWNDARADIARATSDAHSTLLVAIDGATLAGTVMAGGDGHRGWVYYLAVAPDRRGEGLGRALMDAATSWLLARGVPKLQLMVRDGNDEAERFYEALGFERQAVSVYGRWLKV